ncbi:protein of unknown function (plasmid) [Cupriavidus taiwanensis]|uniref:Uncharacterized protein n=1 Tax=Cupriavidus taiwanensis TaxID=164546 RepID=A0A375EEW3_9BURK|nr:protein of unknown function [Cupriavidus taiwanensis]SOZ72322.1 protein of unknown function [Cupriavidus taiwanensis]SOZ74613.1 protein of unknown function [Cupriavidus taiwanensis]SPA11428.1 protein of unknown function [Cupriavidus taiwanensis]
MGGLGSCCDDRNILETNIRVMRGARALARHHARAHGILGRADRAEQRAVARVLETAQDRPALALAMIGNGPVGESVAAFRVVSRVLRANAQRARGDLAEATPLERPARFEHVLHERLCGRIARARDGAREFVLHLGAPVVDLAHEHEDRLHHVERLEAGDHDGLAIPLRESLIRRGADHDADVRGADVAVEWHRVRVDGRRGEQMRDRGGREHMAAQHAEVLRAARRRLAHDERRGGRGGLEADGEKDDLALRMLACDAQRVARRIHHADVRAARLGPLERQAVRGGHAHRVAIGAEDHAVFEREPNRQIDAPDRQHANRAAGTVDHPHVFRQEIGHAVAGNRVRMTAAELHEVVAAPGLRLRLDAPGNARGDFAVAEFVDIFHCAAPGCATDASCASPSDWATSPNSASVRSASSGSITPSAKPTCTIT